MILSRYCKVFPSEEAPGSLVLFSTKKASKINIHKSMLKKIMEGSISAEDKQKLFDLGFFVNSAEEEKRDMLAYMGSLNEIDDKFSATLVMNLDCNLACKYCFEGTRKGKHYMTKETADLIIDFIKNNAFENKNRLQTVFYGGEPLLSADLIIYIAQKLKALAEAAGVTYSSAMVTNGTLLNPTVVERLSTVGLKMASITVDGPREIHDSFRPFKSGNGSFDTIIRNVKDICEMTGVQIGGNFTQENYRVFPQLLDYMMENGLTPDKITDFRFDFVMKETEGIAPPDFHQGCETINEPWLFEASIFLRAEILKRGYNTGKIMPSVCSLEYDSSLVINYDGSFYKCTGFLGREEFRIGDINSGIRDGSVSHNLGSWKNDECLDCEYLPLCFGGCRYLKFVRVGNMDGVDCKKPYLDATLEALVKQDIKYGLTAK